MTAKDLLRQSIEFGHRVTRGFVEDLTDAELLVRSVPGANHIAWQLGHMIGSVRRMLSALGCPAPALPDGFRAAAEMFEGRVRSQGSLIEAILLPVMLLLIIGFVGTFVTAMFLPLISLIEKLS